jgi:hypothetical protein
MIKQIIEKCNDIKNELKIKWTNGKMDDTDQSEGLRVLNCILPDLEKAMQEHEKLIHHTFEESEVLLKQINYIENHKGWVINDEFLENMYKIK